MNRYYGKIGFIKDVETPEGSGVWVEEITERNYFGNIVKNSRSLQNGSGINDDININMSISIVADPYALENFHRMKYVEFMGAQWKVTSVDVEYPRLTLSVGGLYNDAQQA